jgi:exodeoxyribonuclease VII small subunit
MDGINPAPFRATVLDNQPTMTKPTAMPPSWSYEETVETIEAIVTRLEQGELPLAAVFEEFEQAVQHLRQCEDFLQARQAQVDLLIETLDNG